MSSNPKGRFNLSSFSGGARTPTENSQSRPLTPNSKPVNHEPQELTSLISNLNTNVVMKVSSSEPRDALQSERTCLTFIRFASTLFFTALGIVLNFRFKTSSSKSEDGHGSQRSTYSTVVSFILIFLSLAVLVVSGFSYMITINRYAAHKINNYGFNNFTSVICFTSVVITLMGISITLIVEGYLEEES